jgi:hypothetical protein
MGIFGGPHKTIKKLDEALISARAAMSLMPTLPEANRQTTIERILQQVTDCCRAASQAGYKAEANELLQRAVTNPPTAETPELTWSGLVQIARRAL